MSSMASSMTRYWVMLRQPREWKRSFWLGRTSSQWRKMAGCFEINQVYKGSPLLSQIKLQMMDGLRKVLSGFIT
eukprot:10508897-Ditylum_brightwellii.AAC.1